MITLIAAIVVLGILVFVHELGHFIVAKAFGVGVEKFSLGFGRKIIGWKYGETEYLISAFPLGGYVKMVGESPDSELSPEEFEKSFIGKHPLKRILIVAAGPGFNLLFAWLAFVVVLMLGIPTLTAKVGSVVPDKPAAKAGLMENDVVTAVDGKAVKRWDDLSGLIAEKKGKPVEITILREGKSLTYWIAPEIGKAQNLFGEAIERPIIGIGPSEAVVTERLGLPSALVKAAEHTWNIIYLTLVAFQKIIMRAISLDNLGGPIMIVMESGKQFAAGFLQLASFMAALSINLAILNLLPVPILDGGHLVFYAWELVTRKPVSEKVRDIGQRLGLVFLLSLLLLATYNDIARYWKDIVRFLTASAP
jgi:regulator of sigma E protease